MSSEPQRLRICLIGAFLVSALAACEGGDAPTQFVAGSPLTVSGASPFAECRADADPESRYWLDSEVEPWIVVNPNDSKHLAAIWQQDRHLDAGCRGHVSAVSFDGGATWSTSVIPGLTLCSGGNLARASDPWLAFGANGYLYSASLAFTEAAVERFLFVNRSTDGGLTWADPVLVSAGPGLDDKESMTANPERDCFVYLTWSQLSERAVGGRVLFSRTSDCGESWTEPREIDARDPYGFDAQLVVLPSGQLLVFFIEASLEDRDLPIYVSRSGDEGENWSRPSVAVYARQASVVTPGQEMPLRTHRPGFDVALDREAGSIHLVWEHVFDLDGSTVQVAFASSSDGGATWSTPTRIDRTPPNATPTLEQAFLPSVEVSGDGTVGVTYYNFQNDDLAEEPPASADHWFIWCQPRWSDCTEPTDWSDPLHLTTQSFDFLHAPESTRGSFLGDYVGLAASSSDFFAFFSVTTVDDPANAVFVPILER